MRALPVGQKLRREIQRPHDEPRSERAPNLARPLGHEHAVRPPRAHLPQANDILDARIVDRRDHDMPNLDMSSVRHRSRSATTCDESEADDALEGSGT
jgi:hypothetical protein